MPVANHYIMCHMDTMNGVTKNNPSIILNKELEIVISLVQDGFGSINKQ